MTKAVTTPVQGEVVAANADLSPATIAEVVKLFNNVPNATGSADGMAQNVLTSSIDSMVGVDASASLPDSAAVEKYGQLRIDVNGLRKSDSDISTSPFPYFLIVESTVVNDSQYAKSGDVIMWQSSAVDVTLKLLRIFTENRLPAVVSTQKTTKATEAGFFPVNLNIHEVAPVAPAVLQ